MVARPLIGALLPLISRVSVTARTVIVLSSPIDKASLNKWDDYTEAKEAMFFHTDTADAPWTIVKSDDKKRARLNCMKHVLSLLDYPEKDKKIVGHPDPLIVGSSSHVIGNSEHILGKSLHPEQRRSR